MQPDDPSITPVSTAAAAIAFSIFLVPLMDHAFLLMELPSRKCRPTIGCYRGSFNACAILRKERKEWRRRFEAPVGNELVCGAWPDSSMERQPFAITHTGAKIPVRPAAGPTPIMCL